MGRKRNILVDTQGNLLAARVNAANNSDQQGGRALLSLLKKPLPRLVLIWGDNHYGGTFLIWAKITLGWFIQTIKAFIVPKRGLLVPEGEEVDWDQLFPKGFRPQPRRWVVERTFAQDSPLPRPSGAAQQQWGVDQDRVRWTVACCTYRCLLPSRMENQTLS